jgi:hypothetical protein
VTVWELWSRRYFLVLAGNRILAVQSKASRYIDRTVSAVLGLNLVVSNGRAACETLNRNRISVSTLYFLCVRGKSFIHLSYKHEIHLNN